jgi:glycosyltransferase involved in cell wall biosynthesis
LRAKFELPARFVHLPNQLWKHKNHELVVEALARTPEVVVVATGPTENYRHAGLFTDLMAQVRKLGLGERFRHLGLVSFAEMISLMRHSVAVINPSRFEGWSTTVEEAKSLGKRLLVSDIPVHREQAPARASYFGVDDPAAVAAQLAEAWSAYDPEADGIAAAEAAQLLPGRTRAFAETYESIVRDVVAR